ncbi:DUF6994 family protein [Ruminococcus sp.]
MKRYEPKNFEKNYTNYILHLLTKDYEFCKSREAAEKKCNKIVLYLRKKGKIIKDKSERSNKLYIDPDAKENKGFYRDLSNFLNAASWKNKKNLYFKANEAPYGMITVYYKDKKGEEHHFTLHSDQLGFSAVPCTYFKQNYPLSRYLEMQKNKSDKDPDAIAEFLANYVYTTRTIGGSFLWPETLWKSYNPGRGCAKIEDRVDLTLLEIKHYFEYRELDDKKKFKYSGDILLRYYDNLDAQTWFGFFDSFEDYVDFFLFNGFVKEINKNGKKEYMPINILTGDLNYETNTLKDIKDEKQLKAMLDLVMRKVKTRSVDMEKLIAKYNQTNDTKGETNENILHE